MYNFIRLCISLSSSTWVFFNLEDWVGEFSNHALPLMYMSWVFCIIVVYSLLGCIFKKKEEYLDSDVVDDLVSQKDSLKEQVEKVIKDLEQEEK